VSGRCLLEGRVIPDYKKGSEAREGEDADGQFKGTFGVRPLSEKGDSYPTSNGARKGDREQGDKRPWKGTAIAAPPLKLHRRHASEKRDGPGRRTRLSCL